MKSDATEAYVARPSICSSVGSTLREHLLGTWALRSYIEHPLDGAASHYPFGEAAKGLLIYSPDGFMSAQLMPQSRSQFESGDWFHATLSELRDASAFVAYSGRFFVDEAAESVTHEIEVSFFPNWIGKTQVRFVGRHGEELVLRPNKPIRSGGREVMPTIRWSRPSKVQDDACESGSEMATPLGCDETAEPVTNMQRR